MRQHSVVICKHSVATGVGLLVFYAYQHSRNRCNHSQYMSTYSLMGHIIVVSAVTGLFYFSTTTVTWLPCSERETERLPSVLDDEL